MNLKPNYPQLAFLIFALICATLAAAVLYGCSDAKQAAKGYAKFIEHGGTIEVKKIEITIRDTIRINGRDSIIEKTILVDCPKVETPKTRYEIKWKYKYDLKRQKARDAFVTDSLNDLHDKELKLAKQSKKVTVSNNSLAKKKSNNETKENTQWSKTINWIVICACIVLVLIIINRIFKI